MRSMLCFYNVCPSALSSVFAVRERWVVCYSYIYAPTLRVLIIMCTNPYRKDGPH